MKVQPSYIELLRDPRWQRRRLEIMSRDRFQCRGCMSKVKTLNVHHSLYIKGRKPWEYEGHLLFTFCEECHANRHKLKDKLLTTIGRLTDSSDVEEVIGFALGLLLRNYDVNGVAVGSGHVERGLLAAYGLSEPIDPGEHLDFFLPDERYPIDEQTIRSAIARKVVRRRPVTFRK